MERAEPEASTSLIAPGAALALALAAIGALFLGVADVVGIRSETEERISTASYVLGWPFLMWGAIIAGCCAVLLVPRVVRRQPISPLYVAVLVGALALVALPFLLYPLWGSGSASAVG